MYTSYNLIILEFLVKKEEIKFPIFFENFKIINYLISIVDLHSFILEKTLQSGEIIIFNVARK